MSARTKWTRCARVAVPIELLVGNHHSSFGYGRVETHPFYAVIPPPYLMDVLA